jgi:hypothetical protein
MIPTYGLFKLCLGLDGACRFAVQGSDTTMLNKDILLVQKKSPGIFMPAACDVLFILLIYLYF